MFRNEMFANYLKYTTTPFPVPPRSLAPSTSRFVVYDTPVMHSATRMYACHMCSKYSAKYDPINYGYNYGVYAHPPPPHPGPTGALWGKAMDPPPLFWGRETQTNMFYK